MFVPLRIALRLLVDVAGLIALSVGLRRAIEAENLMLNRQFALYKERDIKSRRVDAATRASLALLSRRCNWRDALVVMRSETLTRWHRTDWRVFWRWQATPGRPRGDQRWSTCLRHHAKAIVACDFFVAVTAMFRMIHGLVVIHHGSRRLLHFNLTEHRSADWTLWPSHARLDCLPSDRSAAARRRCRRGSARARLAAIAQS